jgi:phosphatidylserine/phosphatidylglycerophosphate/cardiolipin synthase-like enzyme
VKRWKWFALLAIVAAWLGVAWWHSRKPLAAGLHAASPLCAAETPQVAFIADITAADAFGRPAASQGIFDSVLQLVHGARRFVVLDYGAFGAEAGERAPQRRIAGELTDALLERRREDPSLAVLFITDPANERYGAVRSSELQLLRAAGVDVVAADLDRLRDPNPAYSSLWRLTLRWWDTPSAPLGVLTRRLNFKTDGRRLVIADDGAGGLAAVVGSAGARDAESAWSNVAARIAGGALSPLLASELAIARFSGWRGSAAAFTPGQEAPPAACTAAAAAVKAEHLMGVQVLTEGATRAALLEHLDAAGASDSIDVAMFHVADRAVIASLLAAARRGVGVRMILDPNESGSTGGTSGMPNQPVASELVSRSGGAIRVRWYRTHGERFHSALVMIHGTQGMWLTLGSAQLTRRSLDDYNLEANVALSLAPDAPLARQALAWFDALWSNRAGLGIEYTAEFAAYADPAQSHYWLYRLMEGAGLSGF